MKRIFLLGSTGSIGSNTLDVARQHPDKFQIVAVVANRNIKKLAEQVQQFKPICAVVYDYNSFLKLRSDNMFSTTRLLYGEEGLYQALECTHPDIFVNAFVGFAGLVPTIAAIKKKIKIALANKETLVVAGSLIKKLLDRYDVPLYPIDSEHSAIWQCLAGEKGNVIQRLIITASGGPFRTFSKDQLKRVTPEAALKHPNWTMGAKITIDSATLMNKGLEVIEAYWLYNIPVEKIEIVVHPLSIIHSMVEFEDCSIKAQLGIPDMRIPIQYALSAPERYPLKVPQMDFSKITQLTFEKPDYEKFPCLALAFEAIKKGATCPAVLNAANEEAVYAFLKKRIRFTDIPVVIEQVMQDHTPIEEATLEDYLQVDKEARIKAKKACSVKLSLR
jgi:1-deoxy-D-xylulose-5-phosphate reductoisomerase